MKRIIIATTIVSALAVSGVALASQNFQTQAPKETNNIKVDKIDKGDWDCHKPPVILKGLSEKDLKTQNDNLDRFHRDCDKKTPTPTPTPTVSPSTAPTPLVTPIVIPVPTNTNVTVNGATGATGASGTSGTSNVSGISSLPTVGGTGQLNP